MGRTAWKLWAVLAMLWSVMACASGWPGDSAMGDYLVPGASEGDAPASSLPRSSDPSSLDEDAPCVRLVEYEFIDPAFATCVYTLRDDGRYLMEGAICPAEAPPVRIIEPHRLDLLQSMLDRARFYDLERYYPAPGV
ncbi:MAG TPA: hypothetical protein GX702_08365 [Chloroflexi bacterium]|jgi:hypothetical protein|nr:hypothetical protein [Chloroflexota bacterium]